MAQGQGAVQRGVVAVGRGAKRARGGQVADGQAVVGALMPRRMDGCRVKPWPAYSGLVGAMTKRGHAMMRLSQFRNRLQPECRVQSE